MNSAFVSLIALLLVAVAAKPSQVSNSANSLDNRAYNEPNCTSSEVPSTCGANPGCQETCDNLGKPIACTRSLVANICWPGCVCKSGFVRVVQGDQCIPIDKCEGRVRH